MLSYLLLNDIFILTNLNLSTNVGITILSLNDLTSLSTLLLPTTIKILNLAFLPALSTLDLTNFTITSLNLHNLLSLTTLTLTNNGASNVLQNITLTNLVSLQSLDISTNTLVTYISLGFLNSLTEFKFDITSNNKLATLYIMECAITTLNIVNNNIIDLQLSNLQNLATLTLNTNT